MNCILCDSKSPGSLAKDYFWCKVCDLRFLDPAKRLSPDEEKARYLTHNNDTSDVRYQKFVEPLYLEVAKRVGKSARGLDFGAGAGPVLAEIFQRNGYDISLYDPLFHPNQEALQKKYDFISASEVVEHFFNPSIELKKLRSLLNNPGLLVIMTLLIDEQTDFQNWYYRKDPTHVTFYSKKTLQWIQTQFQFSSLEILSDRLIVFTA